MKNGLRQKTTFDHSKWANVEILTFDLQKGANVQRLYIVFEFLIM